MPLPPTLTPEQRQAALKKAAEARRVRAEVKAQLKPSLSLRDLFDQSDSDDMLAKLKVVSVLESLPGVGKVRRAGSWPSSTSARAGGSARARGTGGSR